MDAKVRESLARAEQRAEELTAKLSDPAVYGDQKIYRDLSKERAGLAPLVAAWERYRALETELAGARELAATETDPELREMAAAEIARLEASLAPLEDEITVLLIPKDPDDDKAAVVEIRAGTGGEEAALFAAEVFRMYTRCAEAHGWRGEVLSTSESAGGGMKEVVVGVEGEGVYGRLKFESG